MKEALVKAGVIAADKIQAGVIQDSDGELERMTADFLRELKEAKMKTTYITQNIPAWSTVRAAFFVGLILGASLLLVGCSTGPDYNVIAVGNHFSAPEATVIVTRGSDTLYNTTFPAGASSCGPIDGSDNVSIAVVRADTTAVFPSVSLDRIVIRVESFDSFIRLTKDDNDNC